MRHASPGAGVSDKADQADRALRGGRRDRHRRAHRGQKLQDKWGPAVIVENRAGAGGNVGAEAVFTAAPDGYTLLFTAQGPLVVNQYLFEKIPYEPEKFTPVSLVDGGL